MIKKCILSVKKQLKVLFFISFQTGGLRVLSVSLCYYMFLWAEWLALSLRLSLKTSSSFPLFLLDVHFCAHKLTMWLRLDFSNPVCIHLRCAWLSGSPNVPWKMLEHGSCFTASPYQSSTWLTSPMTSNWRLLFLMYCSGFWPAGVQQARHFCELNRTRCSYCPSLTWEKKRISKSECQSSKGWT